MLEFSRHRPSQSSFTTLSLSIGRRTLTLSHRDRVVLHIHHGGPLGHYLYLAKHRTQYLPDCWRLRPGSPSWSSLVQKSRLDDQSRAYALLSLQLTCALSVSNQSLTSMSTSWPVHCSWWLYFSEPCESLLTQLTFLLGISF